MRDQNDLKNYTKQVSIVFLKFLMAPHPHPSPLGILLKLASNGRESGKKTKQNKTKQTNKKPCRNKSDLWLPEVSIGISGN